MLTVTLEMIRDNPWNAVNHMLPSKMDKMLFKAALAAVAYCRSSEFAFAVAAKEELYKPATWLKFPRKPWWECMALKSDQEVEQRWWAASVRYVELLALRKDSMGPEPEPKEETCF